ncbi:MAG: hypothetical protein DRH26_17805 [Deltaproteobacteria bacterium]|nr:MAG: hypothetical protein DRH26_17805 [Deltaproteobacteria bacterium]
MIDPVPVQVNSNLLGTHFFDKVGDENTGPMLSQSVLGAKTASNQLELFLPVLALAIFTG